MKAQRLAWRVTKVVETVDGHKGDWAQCLPYCLAWKLVLASRETRCLLRAGAFTLCATSDFASFNTHRASLWSLTDPDRHRAWIQQAKMSKTKVSKNAFRRQQKKLKKEVGNCVPTSPRNTDCAIQETPAPAETDVSVPAAPAAGPEDGANLPPASASEEASDSVAEAIDFDFSNLPEFQRVFQRFQEPQEHGAVKPHEKEQVIWEEDNDNIPDEEAELAAPRKSKKQRKRENKLSVAELKAMAQKPELVEWTDADSSDPRLLLSIKPHRNVVPVPAHWSLKREVCTEYSNCWSTQNMSANYGTVSIVKTRYREARVPPSQVHRRYWNRRDA